MVDMDTHHHSHLYAVDHCGRVWVMDLGSGSSSSSGQRSHSIEGSLGSGSYSPSSTTRSVHGQTQSSSSMSTGTGSKSHCWTLLPNPTKIDMKRVSSRNGIIWGISSDHQLHFYVHRQDIPIRVREELWENQRWNPISNWSDQLLPTDRPHFSTEDGLQSRTKDSVTLPNSEWTWESNDWQIETVFGTTLLEPEGWTYAVDFPANYHAHKSWSSCVRRRKWWRVRKFCGFNRWIPIAPIHKDHTMEPFTDISISSFGLEKDLFCVWALTVLGQCWFRTGVNLASCPEGQTWECVQIPKGLEACQISVGANGVPFVVTWTGSLLFRSGLTARCLQGTKWIEKNGPPGGLMHMSAGAQTLWAATRDRNCWALKTDLQEALGTENAPFEWKAIPGKIKSISVSKNDMVVLALNDDTNQLITRTGIQFPDQRHGQGWKDVFSDAGARDWDTVSRDSSTSGQDELDSVSMKSIRPDYPEESLESSGSGQGHGPSNFCWVDGGCLSALRLSSLDNDIEVGPWRNDILLGIQKLTMKNEKFSGSGQYFPAIDESEYEKAWKTKSTGTAKMLEHGHGHASGHSWSKGTLEVLNNDTLVFHKNLNQTWMASIADIVSIFKVHEISVRFTLRIRNPVDPEHADFVSLKFENENEMQEWYELLLSLSITKLDEDLYTLGNIWLTTTAGELHNCGMLKIMDVPIGSGDLVAESSNAQNQYEHVHPLIQGFLPGTVITIDISIPQSPPPESFRFNLLGRGNLVAFHYNPRFGSTNQIVRNSKINEIWGNEERDGDFPFCPGKKYTVTFESTESHIISTVHIKEFKQKKRFMISFKHRVSPKFITKWVGSGDVHILGIRYDPKSSEEFLQPEFVSRPVPGHFWKIESTANGWTWGIGWDGNVWISATRFKKSKAKNVEDSSSSSSMSTFTDSQTFYIYENERWNPVGGWCTQLLPTDRSNWSDETGRIPLEKDSIRLPSSDWHWENDWEIDYSAPGGVDPAGFQYALDFPASYHESKRLNDFVRRRRWKRICTFRVKGPWTHVHGVKLVDLSIQVNEDCDWEVLGVRDNGESVIRAGISPDTPAGTHWESIADDVPLISISSHFGQRAWAIGKNGFSYIRYGKWQMLDRPKESPLKSICVGANGVVWAVGTNHTLYRRSDVLLPILPEGKDWIKVCDGVAQVSMGLGDELWAILKLGHSGTFKWTLGKRDGISGNHPGGIGWTHVAEGPWHYLSITGAYKRNR